MYKVIKDYRTYDNKKLKGKYFEAEREMLLQDAPLNLALINYMKDQKWTLDDLLYYGHIDGLGYFIKASDLEAPSYIKGYSYVKVSLREILNYGGMGVCDFCNEFMADGGYLMFILNSCICPKCFKKLKLKQHPEDLKLQEELHLDWYRNHGVIK